MSMRIAKKRKELREALSAENKTTMVDVLLGWVGRGRPISTWSGIFMVFFPTLLIALLLGLLSGDFHSIARAGFEVPPFWVVWSVFNLFTCTASMLLSNVFFHRMVSLLHNQVLDKAKSNETLLAVQSWIESVCNRRPIAVGFILLGGFLISAVMVNMTRDFTGPLSGLRLTLFLWLFMSQAFIFLIFLIFTLVLSLRMKHFKLTLFEADPASSEVISQLSAWFSSVVFLVAAYGALQTFGLIRFELINYYVSLLFVFWMPTIAIFVACHLSLSSIIQRAKWETLNSLQQKIAFTQNRESLMSKGSREHLVWLLDYHDRVKATRNSSIDLRSGINLLNSLLLPVIAFILGNMDVIAALLSKKP